MIIKKEGWMRDENLAKVAEKQVNQKYKQIVVESRKSQSA